MGRRTHFGSHSFAIPQKYEVKIRSRNFIDRIKNNGEEVEGGKTFSRHIEANSPRHARIRGERWGRVISVTKLKPEDVKGTIESMKLRDIISKGIDINKGGEKKRDVILDNITLDEIIYNRKRK